MPSKRVLMIAWSAAEWAAIHPAMDRGDMPNLRSLVEGGASGMLATIPPLSTPAVAATLATGRHPETHGVLTDLEPRPDGGGVGPTGRRSWRAPAIWQMLSDAGLRTAVVNWPATTPADRWPGIVVDGEFAVAAGRRFEDWPLPPHCVSPESFRATMRDLRVHPSEIGTAELSALLPGLGEIDRKRDRRPARLAVSLARTASAHAVATHLAESIDWNLLLVRYTLLADVGRDLAGAGGEPLYADAARGAYNLLDVMLGRLAALAGPETAVLIVAPGGWRAAGAALADLMEDETVAARDKGLIVAAGPGIRADAMLHGVNPIDICPTVLAYFGFSAPSDGRVIADLFIDGPPETAPIIPPPGEPVQPTDDPALHLLALGYTDRLSEAQQKAIADTEVAALRNLADAYLSRHAWQKAATLLRTLLARVPNDYLATVKLGRVLLAGGDIEGAKTLAAAAIELRPDLPWGDLLMGSLLAHVGDAETAETHLRRARDVAPKTPLVSLRLGWVAIMLGRWDEAEQSFREVLAQEAMVAEAHAGLGIGLQGQDRTEEAEAALRRSIGLVFDNPVAHFHLGQILAARGAFPEARDALRTAIEQQPRLAEARNLLTRVERAVASGMVAQAMADRARE
ncbi:MAG TPA: tetratricopeptide repeat protein [Alphaproteobacteria bacterium]|nr:tetratricopeptide repeat protein [Alphaproteobacteria bacterium]